MRKTVVQNDPLRGTGDQSRSVSVEVRVTVRF
jgi:hypothetical protein